MSVASVNTDSTCTHSHNATEAVRLSEKTSNVIYSTVAWGRENLVSTAYQGKDAPKDHDNSQADILERDLDPLSVLEDGNLNNSWFAQTDLAPAFSGSHVDSFYGLHTPRDAGDSAHRSLTNHFHYTSESYENLDCSPVSMTDLHVIVDSCLYKPFPTHDTPSEQFHSCIDCGKPFKRPSELRYVHVPKVLHWLVFTSTQKARKGAQ